MIASPDASDSKTFYAARLGKSLLEQTVKEEQVQLKRRMAERVCSETCLDLVALGIVADVAYQSGDARYLLQRGLDILKSQPRPGLQAIYERAELNPHGLSEEHIGFVLAPRWNALGRLGDANPAVELLTTTDRGRARLLALQLEGLNARRQLLTSQVLRGALAQLQQNRALLDEPALVLDHPSWEAGVIGIVARRLVELYGKPVVMISALPGGAGRSRRPRRRGQQSNNSRGKEIEGK